MVLIVYENINKPQPRSTVPKYTKCERLKINYNDALVERFQAIRLDYHRKSFDSVVAYAAKELKENPECIDNTMDKAKIEMWANQYYYLK